MKKLFLIFIIFCYIVGQCNAAHVKGAPENRKKWVKEYMQIAMNDKYPAQSTILKNYKNFLHPNKLSELKLPIEHPYVLMEESPTTSAVSFYASLKDNLLVKAVPPINVLNPQFIWHAGDGCGGDFYSDYLFCDDKNHVVRKTIITYYSLLTTALLSQAKSFPQKNQPLDVGVYKRGDSFARQYEHWFKYTKNTHIPVHAALAKQGLKKVILVFSPLPTGFRALFLTHWAKKMLYSYVNLLNSTRKIS